MHNVKVSSKGQIVIPVDVRKRLKIDQGTRVGILEFGDELALVPLPKDAIKEAKGMLHSKKKVSQMMKELRAEERILEKKKASFSGKQK